MNRESSEPTGRLTEADVQRLVEQRTSQLQATIERLQQELKQRDVEQKTLRKDEEHFRLFFEGSPLGYQSLDEQGRFLDVNSAWLATFGYSRAEVIGSWFGDFLAPEYVERFKERFPQFKAIGETCGVQFEMTRKDGSRILVEFNGKVGYDNEGNFLQTHCVLRDITESQRAEEELREVSTRVTRILESISDGFFALDRNLVVTFFNKAAEDLLGRSSEDVVGRHLFDEAFPEAKGTVFDKEYTKALREGKATSFEAYFDSELYANWYDVRAYPYKEGLSVYFQVTTERKQAEEEMQKLRALLRNMIDSMPSSLVAVDTQGQVTLWNNWAENSMALSPEQAEGQPLEELFPVMREQLDHVRGAIRNREVRNKEKIATYQGGETCFSNVTVYPLLSNGVEGAVIRIDDVTERVRLEEIMIQSEKMMAVGGLAAGMAHEINNPLSGILQNVQVIADRIGGDLPANRQLAEQCGTTLQAIQAYVRGRKINDMLEAVRSSGKRASDIVQNMLSFSRRSDSRIEYHDLAELLDQTLELAASDYDLKKKYDFRQIEVVRRYAPGLPKVPCEATKIQQVILNLLKNGAHAMAEWPDRVQPPCFVLRTAMQQDDMVRIEIGDNGPGMDEPTRRRAFEPFFTTKDVGVGTGLGLSVSYFIITENHGGRMAVESAPGNGTKFIISLPLERQDGRGSGRAS